MIAIISANDHCCVIIPISLAKLLKLWWCDICFITAGHYSRLTLKYNAEFVTHLCFIKKKVQLLDVALGHIAISIWPTLQLICAELTQSLTGIRPPTIGWFTLYLLHSRSSCHSPGLMCSHRCPVQSYRTRAAAAPAHLRIRTALELREEKSSVHTLNVLRLSLPKLNTTNKKNTKVRRTHLWHTKKLL